jgi:solute carrier family 25 oxoglutarate transporter 11
MTAGLIASFIGNPADLALIRMQADSALPLAERRNYTNVVNAFSRIAKEEGVTTLWRGSVTTMVRATFLNLGMLAPYDEAKERLNQWRGERDSNKL